MLQHHIDSDDLEESVKTFCASNEKLKKLTPDERELIDISLSWWEISKIWLPSELKDFTSEVNTVHMAQDSSYMNRIARSINDSSKIFRWGYMVLSTCLDAYDRDNIIASLTLSATGVPKFTVPKSATLDYLTKGKFSANDIRRWKNLCSVKFGVNKIHLVTASNDNFILGVIFAMIACAPGGLFVGHVILNDLTKRYITFLQTYFEYVQIRTSTWSNHVFVCACGFKKCPKKLQTYLIDNSAAIVSGDLIPEIANVATYDIIENPPTNLHDWIADTAF